LRRVNASAVIDEGHGAAIRRNQAAQISLGVTFQAPDRTLRDDELQDFHTRVIEAVGKAGARLRT